MGAERKLALFAAIVAPLAIVALLLALDGDEQPAEPPSAGSRAATEREAESSAVAEEADRVAAEAAERREREEAHVHSAEDGLIPRDVLAREERVQAEAEPVARRFFAAFASYELGESSPAVGAAIEETAAAALGRELRAAPRLPAGAEAPERARVAGELQLVAVDGTETAGLTEVELVGEIERAGERTPIAFRMELAGGRWLVAALGR